MAGNKRRLEHHMSQQAPSASDGAFAAHCAAVMRNRGKSRESRGLFA